VSVNVYNDTAWFQSGSRGGKIAPFTFAVEPGRYTVLQSGCQKQQVTIHRGQKKTITMRAAPAISAAVAKPALVAVNGIPVAQLPKGQTIKTMTPAWVKTYLRAHDSADIEKMPAYKGRTMFVVQRQSSQSVDDMLLKWDVYSQMVNYINTATVNTLQAASSGAASSGARGTTRASNGARNNRLATAISFPGYSSSLISMGDKSGKTTIQNEGAITDAAVFDAALKALDFTVEDTFSTTTRRPDSKNAKTAKDVVTAYMLASVSTDGLNAYVKDALNKTTASDPALQGLLSQPLPAITFPPDGK
jgi:hypothetical protein